MLLNETKNQIYVAGIFFIDVKKFPLDSYDIVTSFVRYVNYFYLMERYLKLKS